MQAAYRTLLALSAACALGAAGALILGHGIASTGPFVVGGLVTLALGSRAIPLLSQLTFTIWIFVSVAVAMYYPQYFLTAGDFELTRLIVPLIMIIMFGMGTSMSLRDFGAVAKMPRAVLVGLVCQFTIMPLVGLTIAWTFGFPDEVAAGIVLVGSVSGGVASNVMAYIARANLALSITMTAVSTLAAPLMTPLLMQVLAGQFVPVDFVAMMLSVAQIVLLPIVLGLIVNRLLDGRARWLSEAMPLLSMAAIAIVLTIIVAAGRDNLLIIGPLLFVAAILHNAIGYLLGYWGGRAVGMDEQSCRTIALEVGMQNGGLATGIAANMGMASTVGLAPAIFGPWMNISGSALANWWRNKPDPEESELTHEDAPVAIPSGLA
ncbi:MAG: bile acid:sodium symporter family protein [Rhodothermales bacterium]